MGSILSSSEVRTRDKQRPEDSLSAPVYSLIGPKLMSFGLSGVIEIKLELTGNEG